MAKWDCAKLSAELKRNQDEASTLEAKIEGSRGRNEAALVATNIVAPAVLLTEQSGPQKQRLDTLQVERDRLMRFQEAKACL